MMQGLAILQDSLRLLRSRHLFWLCILLSAAASFVLFGTYSFNNEGLRVLWFKTWENDSIRAGSAGAHAFITYMFNSVFVGIWLSWGAIILAILSTASIMPDFLASGSIELSLSKPVSRTALFFWRVLGATLFVLLQSAVGVLLAYLLIGFKLGVWLHSCLWAIPLLGLQFFYLYSVSALLAVITRSTIASVIGTILFWLAIFIVQFSSNTLTNFSVQTASAISALETRLKTIEKSAADNHKPLNPGQLDAANRLNEQLAQARKIHEPTDRWARYLESIKVVIPKTGDIQKIIGKIAKAPTQAELKRLLRAEDAERDAIQKHTGMSDEEATDALNARADGERAVNSNVDTAKSIGTSSAFSLAVLGLAAFLFRRREY